MKRIQKDKDNNSELDVNKVARLELARLHRQYRLIEDQRHGYTHESGTTARKTYRMLENLRKEKEDLQPDFSNATSPSNLSKAKLAELVILEVINRYEKYETVIENEIRHIKEMEEQVDKISERVVRQKLKMLNMYGMSITPAQANKKLNISENKLYHMTTRFDEKCYQNSELRSAINNLLRERTRFHNRHNYLKNKIAHVKHQMLHVVQQAAQTYDNRDESVTKIKAIKEREDKESKQHVLEIKEFQRVLHHDDKIHHFLVTKNTQRHVIEDTDQRLLRKDEQKEAEVDEILEKYQDSVKRILSHANFQSVDQLCSYYNELEQQNFSKFMYITDLTHECEALKDALKIIKTNIESSKEVVHQRHKSRMDDLKNKQENIFAQQELLKRIETMTDRTIGKLGKLVEGIATAFDLAGCSNSSVLLLLGNGSGVSTRNALLCLGILEHHIHELKYEKSVLEVRRGVQLKGQSLHNYNKGQGALTKPKTHGGPFRGDTIIPSHLGTNADEEDEKEMYERPYYFEEMKTYVQHQMKEEGLIPERKLELTSSDATVNVSRSPSSHVSLIDKVTAKKNARRRAQEEQERNLAQANKAALESTKSESSDQNQEIPTDHEKSVHVGTGGEVILTWVTSTEETYAPTDSSQGLNDG